MKRLYWAIFIGLSLLFLSWRDLDTNINNASMTISDASSDSNRELTFLTAPENLPDSLNRDPFQSQLYQMKPVLVKRDSTATHLSAPIKEAETPPDIHVDAILWGPNPVVIFRQNGQTELARVGQKVYGVSVVKIEQHRVVIQKDKKEFVIIP